MARKVIAAANNKEQKYFMEEEFKFLPDAIKDDLKKICIMMAEKLNCTFMVGFDDNGDIYKGKYTGKYCKPCESFWTESQLKDGKCPECAAEVTLNHDKEDNLWIGEYADKAEGVIHEFPCPGAVDNHFTDKMLELGSTKNVMFGHDHVCNASINYKGIQLTYGLKLGYGCYYEDGLMGGTTLSVSSDGSAQYAHHFCG